MVARLLFEVRFDREGGRNVAEPRALWIIHCTSGAYTVVDRPPSHNLPTTLRLSSCRSIFLLPWGMADPAVVEQERERLGELEVELALLERNLAGTPVVVAAHSSFQMSSPLGQGHGPHLGTPGARAHWEPQGPGSLWELQGRSSPWGGMCDYCTL